MPQRRNKSEPSISMRRAASSETRAKRTAPSKTTFLPQAVGQALDGLVASKPPKATKAYGRLADGYVQLNVSVRPEVKDRIVELAKSRGLKISESVDEILGLALGLSGTVRD